MIVHLHPTTSGAVAAKLVALRAEEGVAALGRVLTLIIQTQDDATAETAITAANAAARQHPCRVIAVVPGAATAEPGMSAEVRVGSDAGASEVVLLRPTGAAGRDVGTLVNPLLLPDAPTVAWWPGEPPAVPAQDPVGTLARRRITDALATADPPATIRRLRLGYSPGDTDLSWARSTPWRGRLAAALDEPPFEPVVAATVAGERRRPSVSLLAGWLADRLTCPVTIRAVPSGLITEVWLERPSSTIVLRREPNTQVARLSRTGAADQFVSLPVRSLEQCLMEELRFLDPDTTYGDALTSGLAAVRDAEP
ncbi:glucose-6-phosphate dehydrogenase assembly protein OpcA [Georgenia sp. AZ-5]|uniref:glucose-6-phosphate dehydrogenase assembly protein OpcA n=1 Tax=Georgenia sp. AZ-5 TaxID=3367526 RepID=UPI0037552F5C